MGSLPLSTPHRHPCISDKNGASVMILICTVLNIHHNTNSSSSFTLPNASCPRNLCTSRRCGRKVACAGNRCNRQRPHSERKSSMWFASMTAAADICRSRCPLPSTFVCGPEIGRASCCLHSQSGFSQLSVCRLPPFPIHIITMSFEAKKYSGRRWMSALI